jgi:predicted nucleic acid-binding protein
MSRKPRPKLPLYSWDSSTLIAWLKGEQGHLAQIELVASDISNGKGNLICSSQLRFEISQVRHTPENIHRVNSFFKRRNVALIDVNPNVADLAGRLRDDLIAFDKDLRKADAIILATAIMHGADVLHSIDHHHLRLDGLPIVNGLRITRPEPFNRQRPICFGAQDS